MAKSRKHNLFGERLKKAREALGLSLRAVANMVGLSHTSISRYEKGKRFPSSKNLIKLCDKLLLPMEYLFRLEDKE